MDAAQAEIHAYEAPWKALCDFALHSDLDKMSMAGNPHYGQLVSQVRGREGGREGGRAGQKNNLWYRESALAPENGILKIKLNRRTTFIFRVLSKFYTPLVIV